MEHLIPIMNKVQDALVTSGASQMIDLPLIAVVGSQSVGKSSVLESIVGRDFLPRGTGIVTRRPLILQLRNVRGSNEWAEFGHLPGKKFSDFSQVKQEIVDDTERITGTNKAVSEQPILLKIFSPNVIDLTLVDLPGITKVPVGDQPSDIEEQIRKIIYQFIAKSQSIILAVTAANTDIANSDSLQLAREVDPEGVRTIGVLTKVDTMEEGTDCVDVLSGKVYPLKRGYVGVVCRSQKMTNDNCSIRHAIQEEETFFNSHPKYKPFGKRSGIKYLSETLNTMLMHHIRDSLPELREVIHKRLIQVENELAGYGDPLVEVKGNAGALLLHFFSKFARNFQDAIDGKLPAAHTSDYLIGGARINFIFHDWYARALAEFDPLSGLSDQEIRTAIRNATGPKASLFVPEGAFEILVKKQIQQLELPSLHCVDQVYEELQKIVEKCELPEMSRFKNLRDRILDVVRGVLKRCLAPTNQMIHNIIQIELAYINTNHPDFMNNRPPPSPEDNYKNKRAPPGQKQPGLQPIVEKEAPPSPRNDFFNPPSGMTGMLQQRSLFSFLKTQGEKPYPGVPGGNTPNQNSVLVQTKSDTALGVEKPRNESTYRSDTSGFNGSIRLPTVPQVVCPSDRPSEREQIETDLIKSLIWSYFNIVRKNVADAVPKSVMYFMVNTAKDVLQRELVSQLYREELFAELTKEGDGICEKRLQCKQTLRSLRAAMDVISEIRDFPLGPLA